MEVADLEAPGPKITFKNNVVSTQMCELEPVVGIRAAMPPCRRCDWNPHRGVRVPIDPAAPLRRDLPAPFAGAA